MAPPRQHATHNGRFPIPAVGAAFALLAALCMAWLADSGTDYRRMQVAAAHTAPATRDGAFRLIVRTQDAAAVETLVARLGGRTGRRLPGMGSVTVEVPEAQLGMLISSPAVGGVSLDRRVTGALDISSTLVGATWVNDNLGFDGTGIGIAIIDSGVTASHGDLGPGRVVHFVDFLDSPSQPHDLYGHGTHVAGVIGGTGHDSGGVRRGVAPGAHLVVLRTLDEAGRGYISDAIAALDYAVEHRAAYNIRVINLSVAAGVYESYRTDPLTLAARRAVDAGIVVVTAAGNLGRSAAGHVQYGGITAPGNAPWVLTVGAANHNGTLDRSDDEVAAFSSLGPSAIDLVAKPDLIAPGVGIESLASASSTLFSTRAAARVWGTIATGQESYLRLSGTSMAAPFVAGTISLMLQASPALSPRAVKTILQQTAEPLAEYSRMAQGAGLLNARAAVERAVAVLGDPTAAEDLEASAVRALAGRASWAAECRDFDCTEAGLAAACTAVDCLRERFHLWETSTAPAVSTWRGSAQTRGSWND